MGVEGGFVHHRDDPGGETKFGISKRSYPHLNIKNLTKQEAIDIYRRDFWARVPVGLCDVMRWMVFDSAVQHGTKRALTWLEMHPTLLGYTSNRMAFYVALSNWPSFGKGWMNRVASLLQCYRCCNAAMHAAATTRECGGGRWKRHGEWVSE